MYGGLLIIQGAIIAQVAITGLSLPYLSSTHWIAHASLLLAVVSGCISVYYACVLQRIIGKLHQPQQIRQWLSLPPPENSTQREDPEQELGNSPCKASLAAVLIISAPYTMVKFSIFTFLIGLVVYQGFIWLNTLDTAARSGDSQRVFITFVSGMGVCLVFIVCTFAAKNIENMLRTQRMRKINDLSPSRLAAEVFGFRMDRVRDRVHMVRQHLSRGRPSTLPEGQQTRSQNDEQRNQADSFALSSIDK